MEIYEHKEGKRVRHHWLLSFTVLVLLVFGALAVLQTIAIGLIPVLFGIPLTQLQDLLLAQLDHPNARLAFLFIQGLGGGLAFFLGGWLFIHFVDQKTMKLKQQFSYVKFNTLLLLLPLLFGFVMFNSLFVYLNMNMELPEALQGLEEILRRKEEQLMELTKFLTDFENTVELLVGILVIGILAGIGEEYLFRGIIQPKIRQYTGSMHMGVWMTAIVFSAIHFQFFGFLPRMMLGALFGYLYVYSGNLIYPMVAHALNNTITVLMVYMNKMDIMEFDLEESAALYWPYIIIGLVVFMASFSIFLKQQTHRDHGQVA